MTNIIVGEIVINKLEDRGTITSFDGKTITVQYANRIAKLQPDAFEKGFIKYENEKMQNQIDEELRQDAESKEQDAENKMLAAKAAKEACKAMEAQAPVGVKFNSVSIRLDPAPLSLASVKKKHKDTVQKIFDECDKDVDTIYADFHPDMSYVVSTIRRKEYATYFTWVNTPKDVRPTYFRSRYCAGFVTKYGDAYVLRVLSRNDVYTPGIYGGFTVTNSDTTEIIRAICIDGEIYCFSKHLSCEGGKYKNTNLYKKWQASSYLDMVALNEVVRACDCNYLNDYICQKGVTCKNYFKLLTAALHNNKAELLFKNRAFSAIYDIDDVCDFLKDFSPKQIDFASKNNVIKTLPVIKECGIFDVEILRNIDDLMNIKRNGNSTYNSLVQLFTQHNFDISVLNKRLIAFLRNVHDFDPVIYSDYISEISRNPLIIIDNVFDKDYQLLHYAMQLEKDVRYSAQTNEKYIQAAEELSWIDREENGYYVIIPKTIPDFKYEGQLQHNCVYTMEYFKSVIYKHSIIAFLRKDKDTPFVTIEFDYETFEVVQAYGKYNTKIDRELYNFIVDLGKRLHFERMSLE